MKREELDGNSALRGRMPSLTESILVVIGIAACVTFCVMKLKLDAHIPLFMCILAIVVLGLRLGNKWQLIEDGYVSAVNAATSAFFILMMVGILIGVWMISGVITTMIDYGLAILTPRTFLPATVLICSIVSLATGTSWGTAASIGVALIGVGAGLGIPMGYTAGAIVSGSYFGDKMSPLSDTTNLAPAVAGAKLYDHIRAMVPTTGISYIITLAAFTLLTITVDLSGSYDLGRIETIRYALATAQRINPLLLLPPIIVIGSAILKVPAIPGMMLGIVTGAICGAFIQHVSLADIIVAAQYGYEGTISAQEHGKEIADMLNGLLTRGGLQNMMWTISLSWIAIGFGGMLEAIGYLHVILNASIRFLSKTGNLVAATVLACIATNILVGDQYIAIVLPGRLLKPAYEKVGLAPRMLSRTLEDAGTLTSSLVPWSTCGAYMTGALGVSTFVYAPYAILNWVNPIVAIVLAYMGWFVFYEDKSNNRNTKAEGQKIELEPD